MTNESRLLERFVSKILFTDECWIWTAYKGRYGHGAFFIDGKHCYAYRFSYEMFVGPIPEGFEVDHLCLRAECVRPEHLDAVTPRENKRRTKRMIQCVRGHPYTPENTRYHNGGNRYCLACQVLQDRGRRRDGRGREMTRLRIAILDSLGINWRKENKQRRLANGGVKLIKSQHEERE